MAIAIKQVAAKASEGIINITDYRKFKKSNNYSIMRRVYSTLQKFLQYAVI